MEPGFLRDGGQTGMAGISSGLKNNKKKGLDWDLNDWVWDSNQFLATPSNAAAQSCSRELGRADEAINFGGVDKRRRVSLDDNLEECSNAAITAEDHGRMVERGKSSEEGRSTVGGCSSSATSCMVDGCTADLSNARDYHRRHKVCEVHTKSTRVCINDIEHRFCQQCSRFHLLQEFDEGKKSCRSRLAKHNGRRRKVPVQACASGNSLSENQSLTNTLLLLLKQLSGQDSGSSSEQINSPNYLVSLLKNVTANVGTQAYQQMLENANAAAISSNDGHYVLNESTIQKPTSPPIPVGTKSSAVEPPVKRSVQNFDLNDACVEEDESRTNKISFKLFGKEPTDLPVDLRTQILNWLSHYPSDMESYIRPGCVILTIYLRLPNWIWDKLNADPASWIEDLFSISSNGFWEAGWLYSRLQDRLTLSCNGTLMLVSPWQPVIGDKQQIVCVTPIASPCSSTANFLVKGFNIVQPTTKLLCMFHGKYLVQESTQVLTADTMNQGPQCMSFSCSFPTISGRGFIEVEDYDQSSISFPFIVAEESVCSEIRMLEQELNSTEFCDTFKGRADLMASRGQALNFLQEMGWLLQRSHTLATSKDPQYRVEGFPVSRFKWLLSFAVDHVWCAVLKNLLDTLFRGNIALYGLSPVEFAMGEDLVLTAVNKQSKPLVDFLLRYTTHFAPVGSGAAGPVRFLFTPDITGPSDVTPLHIAATITDAAGVLDALTDDPQQLGIEAWKTARDATGFTPEDYARKRGHISYIQMVQNKIDSRLPKAHVSVTMPNSPSTTDIIVNHGDRLNSSSQTTALDVQESQQSDNRRRLSCSHCAQQLACRRRSPRRFLSNRPAVLSLVAIAAVCVCVGLIMQSPPRVSGMRGPFLWSLVNEGAI